MENSTDHKQEEEEQNLKATENIEENPDSDTEAEDDAVEDNSEEEAQEKPDPGAAERINKDKPDPEDDVQNDIETVAP